MKKIKVLFITVLAVILCLLCVANFTFSWFTLPQAKNGDSLEWSDITYDLSSKNGISIQTFESSDDGETFSDTPVTDFSNSAGISGEERKYYRTDIINSSDYAQSVSLYLSSLSIPESSSGSFYLGTNGPLRTYKGYGANNANTTEKTDSVMRVYFQHKDKGIWAENTTFKINVDGTDYYLNYIDGSNPKTYYYDVSTSAKMIYIYIANMEPTDYQRTPNIDISNKTKSFGVWLEDRTNGYNNPNYSISDVGFNVYKYYNTISLDRNVGTFDASLTKGTHYDGSGIEYYSGDTNVFTVDKDTGKITIVGAGSATLYTKVTYNDFDTTDSKEVSTKVTVSNSSTTYTDVPIVTNYKVSAKSDEGNSVVSVYWYIKNNSESGTLVYTIKDLYASL